MANPSGPSDLKTQLAGLPKVELHRHLEGSLRLQTLSEIAAQYKLDLPTDPEKLRPLVQVTDGEPNSSSNFLSKFNVLRRFYQSPEVIQRVTHEVIEDAARDNVHYLELRFTPRALAKTQGYTLHQVTHWVLRSVEEARKAFPQIQVELIASINRHEALDVAEQVMQIAVEHKEDIVALDLAGDEVNFQAEPFVGLFKEAKQAGLGITAHAGEWTGAATVRHAIERLGADRIGHGVRAMEDASVSALARERGTVFEVCVTSNLQSGVIQRMADHPLRRMLQAGLKVTINTDDPAVSDITLTDEYATAVNALALSPARLRSTILIAAQSAFLPPAERRKLEQHFQTALA
jgi:adenosine deaminase